MFSSTSTANASNRKTIIAHLAELAVLDVAIVALMGFVEWRRQGGRRASR